MMLYFSYVLVSVIYQHTSQLAKNSDIVTWLAEKFLCSFFYFILFLYLYNRIVWKNVGSF